MRDRPIAEAPNYTNACLVMFGVNLMWIFTVIWAIWGFLFVLLTGAALNHLMTRLKERAMTRAAQRRRPHA